MIVCIPKEHELARDRMLALISHRGCGKVGEGPLANCAPRSVDGTAARVAWPLNLTSLEEMAAQNGRSSFRSDLLGGAVLRRSRAVSSRTWARCIVYCRCCCCSGPAKPTIAVCQLSVRLQLVIGPGIWALCSGTDQPNACCRLVASLSAS